MRRGIYVALSLAGLAAILLLAVPRLRTTPPRPAETTPAATAPAPRAAVGHRPGDASPNQPVPSTRSHQRATSNQQPAAIAPHPRGRLADPGFRTKRVRRLRREAERSAREAHRRAADEQWTADDSTRPRATRELIAIRNGRVLVYQTENVNAARTTAADLVRNAPPYNVTGSNIVVGIWDGGHVRSSHVEFDERVSHGDTGSLNYHATHVFGTIAAAGVVPNAAGMAPGVLGVSYEWNSDVAEMTARAMAAPHETDGVQLSNHSYGHISGWDFYSWPIRWYGTWGQGYRESEYFGLYSQEAADWDALCYDAPYFLPVKSAGNDRSHGAPAEGQTFEYYDGGWTSKTYDPAVDPLADNADQGGYDTIPDIGNAKNILTVGAVADAVSGGERSVTHADMEPYSGWGPADDGRVKPDVVANGQDLYSTDSGSDTDYTRLTGTSMATPNVTGSAALLADLYRTLSSGMPIPAATLKGLIIHTADDLPPAGPDYRAGWGLMNTEAAARLLERHHAYPAAGHLREDSVDATNAVDTFPLRWDGVNPVRITLCWTDPPGAARSGLDDRDPVLVNDLDLRLIGPDGHTNFPFVLSATNPAAPAVTGDNRIDNVEQIVLAAPRANRSYTVRVAHKGVLADERQHYTLFASGLGTPPEIEHDPLPNTSNTTDPYVVDATVTAQGNLDSASLTLLWTTNQPAADFVAEPLAHVSNDVYRAAIPAHPIGAAISYYLYAQTTNALEMTHPRGAPDQLHVFRVAPSLPLTVFATPDEHGPVAPDYGLHSIASGVTVRATAALTEAAEAGHRFACRGWTGYGSVPHEGASNNVAFRVDRNSLLIWRWQSQYSLEQGATVAGLSDTTTWWDETSEGWTVPAPAVTNVAQTRYRFAEWHIDGARWPDATGVTVNPAGGFPMSQARTATAVYLRADRDDDRDGLADWWEHYFFGSLASGPNQDPDGDGYLNLEEYEDRCDPLDGASQPRGPTVEHTPLADPLPHPAPWTVTATVTDNHAVHDVLLRWRRNALSWRQVAMARIDGSNVYTADIPPPGALGDEIEYLVEATDEAGYLVADGVHRTRVAYPLSTVSHVRHDARLRPGQVTNVFFTISNYGNTDLVWQVTTDRVGLEEDVESGTNGWRHSGANDLWHVSSRRAASGEHAWYCGDADTGLYTDSMNASLVTPPVIVGHSAQLEFMQWCNTELDTGDYTWDGAVVEVSTNDGATYEFITPDGGYPYRIVDNPASPFDPDTPCLGGTGGWEKVRFDLSAYAGQEAQIRFRFGSDGYVVDEGWFVDDIRLHPVTSSSNWLHLAATQGTVRADRNTNAFMHIDASGLQPGQDEALVLRVADNDPLGASATVLVSLQVRSRPRVQLDFAGQAPADGSGRITLSNRVWDADGEVGALEVGISTNGGQTWTAAPVSAVETGRGTAHIDGTNAPQVTGLLMADPPGTAFTNPVTVTMETTLGPQPIVLAPDTVVRCRAWDGTWWSPAVTSSAFMVDNEAPTPPSNLNVPSHTPDQWTSNTVFALNWTDADDGNGVGLGPYVVGIGTHAGSTPAVAHAVTSTSARVATPVGGTSLWVRVHAVDRYGNAGTAVTQGPFRVDAAPPSADNAAVTIHTSADGDYVLGSDIDCAWTGFRDSGSGIAHYYAALHDGGGTVNGQPTGTSAMRLADAHPDRTNTVYVWARDHVGRIGPAARADVLVLSADSDWDGDGRSNGDEDICGTDATDAARVLRVSEKIVPATAGFDTYQHYLTWYGVTNRLYTLHERTSLVHGAWHPMEPYVDIPGSNAPVTVTGNLHVSGYRFYRISVKQQ